jgi:pimeloyl-ACP methyl ester carboxylesterase
MRWKGYFLEALILCLLTAGFASVARGQSLKQVPAKSQGPNLVLKLTTPQKTASVFGQRIVYYEAGRGKTLVLLANLGWDSQMWAQNMPALAQSYHVIAVDLIGTGGSAKPHIDYKMDTWTDFIAEFLSQKGIRKATIIGAVMGGALAVQFALDHPEMSEGLICAASNSGPGKHERGAPQSTGGWPSLAGVRRSLMAALYDKTLVTDELVRSRFEYRLRADDGYTIERHLGDHRAPYSLQELSGIKVPALFVWCRQDEITPLKWGEDFAAAVPGADLAVIDGCGHLPNLEKPGEFNQAIINFLEKHKTPER